MGSVPEMTEGEREEWLAMQALVRRMRPELPSPGSERFRAGVKWWCEGIADLAVDALVRAGLVNRSDLDEAHAVIFQEIQLRLGIHDYPPTREPDGAD